MCRYLFHFKLSFYKCGWTLFIVRTSSVEWGRELGPGFCFVSSFMKATVKSCVIDLFHNGGLFIYSFLSRLQVKLFCILHLRTRSERLIIIHKKEYILRLPLWKRSINQGLCCVKPQGRGTRHTRGIWHSRPSSCHILYPGGIDWCQIPFPWGTFCLI